jgi:hypothetical protein
MTLNQFELCSGNQETYHMLIPRSRSHSITEGLQAKTKDPLWFLSRQWQLGEFEAVNGGTPVKTEVNYQEQSLEAINLRIEDDRNFTAIANPEQPLEIIVEEETEVTTAPAWDSQQLEYKFAVKSGNTKLNASEYYGGRLDWYDYDQAGQVQFSAPVSNISAAPSRVSFNGMPNTRWWQLEDSKVEFGEIARPNLNFLSMILIEFSLVYGNDWYLVPIKQRVNTLRLVNDLLVTDTFGNVKRIEPILDNTPDQHLWSMFTLSDAKQPSSAGSRLLFLHNTVVHSQEGEPLEEVTFARDEMANLVWAIEHKYSANGQVINRDDQERAKEQPEITVPAPIYRLKSYVPANWIPYVPRRLSEYGGDIILRRGRTDEAANATNPQYKGEILKKSITVYEEEVPATPIQITRRWELVTFGSEQWRLVNSNGWELVREDTKQVKTWVGRDKKPAKKQGESGLKFDFIVEKK